MMEQFEEKKQGGKVDKFSINNPTKSQSQSIFLENQCDRDNEKNWDGNKTRGQGNVDACKLSF